MKDQERKVLYDQADRIIDLHKTERKQSIRDSSQWDGLFQELLTGETPVQTPRDLAVAAELTPVTVPMAVELTKFNEVATQLPSQSQVRAVQFFPIDSSLSSPSGRYRLSFQADGNVVLYEDDLPISATMTSGSGLQYVFQDDGNLVIYSVGRPIANTGSQGRGGQILSVENDGNIVIYTASGRPIWSRKDEKGKRSFFKDVNSKTAKLWRKVDSAKVIARGY